MSVETAPRGYVLPTPPSTGGRPGRFVRDRFGSVWSVFWDGSQGRRLPADSPARAWGRCVALGPTKPNGLYDVGSVLAWNCLLIYGRLDDCAPPDGAS